MAQVSKYNRVVLGTRLREALWPNHTHTLSMQVPTSWQIALMSAPVILSGLATSFSKVRDANKMVAQEDIQCFVDLY